jgi:hypothetical protein
MKFFRAVTLKLITLLALSASYTYAAQPVKIVDATGTATTNVATVTDNKLLGINISYLTALSEGSFADRVLFSLTAHSAVINTGDQAFWSVPPATQTEYVWPAAAATITVESSSAADDVGSTGATEVTITGLLSDYSETTEVFATDGVTPVAGVKEFFRINEAKVTAAGTGGKNAGNIIVKQGANILSWISAGENLSEQLIFTVPLGESLSVEKMLGSGAGNKNVHVHIYTRAFGGLFISDNHRTVNNSPFFMSHDYLLEKTDFMGVVHSDVNGGVADITIEGALITNP